ncbi:hypothetical protein K7I13_03950 [Brucepastera parasyntrophica]|uniref:hypothetical protein n=1 Tax=Brucepastera parasyntrophica TaxID=2880008 RepID=UPI0021087C2D|nr:hypothetical protein [Brucepastera parasyntrophica]ULQ60472.1 hypothetical protein K7I13_03950 [Brucepastera parasyntrophica]
MPEKQLFIIRLFLFIAGFVILLFVFFLITANADLGTADRFIWASAGSVYIAAFCPFLFSPSGKKSIFGKMPPHILLWLGAMAYIIISTVVILLVRFILPVYAAAAIQCIAVFLYAALISFVCFSKHPARKIAAPAIGTSQTIQLIKSELASLSVKMAGLPQEYNEAKKEIEINLEAVKKFLPLENNTETDIEAGILDSIRQIDQSSDVILSGGNPPSFENEVKELSSLIEKRAMKTPV